MKNSVFKDREFLSKLLKLTLPIAFQSLMLASVAAADALMLGNIEQNAMAAVSLATQIQFVQNIFIMSAIAVTVALGAQYWGKGDMRAIDQIFAISLRILSLVSLLFFAGCELAPRTLMRLFTNEEALVGIGIRYLRIAGWSYLITGASQTWLAVMKISGHARETAVVSTGAVIINIILNAVFIYGLFGLPRMEERGAALATLIARIAELAWAVIFSFKPGFVRPKPAEFFKRNRLLSRDFIKMSLPLLGAGLLWGVGFTAYSAFMGHLGADAAAANSVASVVRDLICCLNMGIATGGGIMVGNEMGAGRLDTAKLYGDRIFRLAFLCGFVSTGLMLLVTPLVMRFVKLSGGAHDYLLGMMLIMSVYMIGRCVNTILINGIFDSGGDTVFDLYSLAIVMWGIAVPLAALGTFVFHWHPLAVYACTCLDEVGKIPWVCARYRKYIWLKNLTRDDLNNQPEVNA